MATTCPDITTLTPALFPNTCLIASISSNIPLLSALDTCCGSTNVHTSRDFCYTYCNITAASDIPSWTNCLGASVDAADLKGLDVGCVANFGTKAAASAAIATTWPAQQVLTSVGVVGATAAGGSSAALSTSTGTSGARSSSVSASSSTATSVGKVSGAGAGKRMSSLVVGVGILLFLGTLA